MTYDPLNPRSVALRPETHIANAVLPLALLKLLLTAPRP